MNPHQRQRLYRLQAKSKRRVIRLEADSSYPVVNEYRATMQGVQPKNTKSIKALGDHLAGGIQDVQLFLQDFSAAVVKESAQQQSMDGELKRLRQVRTFSSHRRPC